MVHLHYIYIWYARYVSKLVGAYPNRVLFENMQNNIENETKSEKIQIVRPVEDFETAFLSFVGRREQTQLMFCLKSCLVCYILF